VYRDSVYKAIPLDKEPGFAIVMRSDVELCARLALSPKFYQELEDTVPSNSFRSAQLAYFLLTRDIAKYEDDPGLVRLLRRGYDERHAACGLGMLIKSLKPQGEVTVRPVHRASAFAYNGICKYINHYLVPLKMFPHIASSADKVAASVCSKRCFRPSFLVKLDLKDYYLSGSASEVARDATSHFESATLRALIRRCILFVLSQQYVVTKDIPGAAFRCFRGCGMGLCLSSAVSNAALVNLCERDCILSPGVLRKHGIMSYMRYEDDTLLHCVSSRGFHTWFNRFSKLANYFKFKVEEASTVSLPFLNLNVIVGAPGEYFSTVPYFKDSTLRRPLSVHSAHPMSLHYSWPVQYLRGLIPLSSNEEGFVRVQKYIISRFVDAGAPATLCGTFSSGLIEASYCEKEK
jgi:hypothetical protein